MWTRSLGVLMIAVIFCLLYSEIEASEQSELNHGSSKNIKSVNRPGDGFLKGTEELHTYASVIAGDSGKGEMPALHVGYGYFLWDRFSVNIDLLGAYIRSGIDDNGAAVGLDVLLREHFYNSNDGIWSMYFDAGSGFQQQSTNFSGRRHFNFRLFGGFGGTMKVFNNIRMMGGVRYLHISDAGIKGGGGGYDGFMFYYGAGFPF
jgi:hypothetical protein